MVNTTSRGGITSCYLRLAFLANSTSVEFEVELAWPAEVAAGGGGDSGAGLPLLMTQWNHRSWGLQGVQRGYMMVLYPGADSRDVSGAFRAAFLASTMRKILARAFVASRTLDVLLVKGGVPHLPPIDPTRVAITGHSRNGKQALIAAAFDERISVVVGSSPGMPVTPVRFSSPDYNGGFTAFAAWPRRDWWLPSLHSYLGREHELPADGHMILALIAPRYALLATARSDGESDSSFANEQSIVANRPVWELLTGSSDGVRIKWREGRHHGFVSPQTYIDWFDYSAATPASRRRPKAFPAVAEELPHGDWNWSAWRKGSAATTPPPPVPSAPLAERVKWMLGSGTETTTGGLVGGSGYCESGGVGSEWDFKAKLMMHDSFPACRDLGQADITGAGDGAGFSAPCRHNVTRIALSFGAYLTASLFVPCANATCDELAGKPALPIMIFLHGYSFHLGFTGVFGLYGGGGNESATEGGLIPQLVGRLGIAVLAWDLPGHGARQTEGTAAFYRRYGTASQLGAMVGEVESALHFIHCSPPGANNTPPECSDGNAWESHAQLNVPALDTTRVFLLGYSLGATVALHAAALFPKTIAGVAAFGGWTPFEAGRNSTSASAIAMGGNRMIYSIYGLLPRLGIFSEDLHAQLPYDYAELIASIAPRPTLLYAPLGNRFTVPSAVAAAARNASQAWGSSSSANFTFFTPQAPSEFASAEIVAALHWAEAFVALHTDDSDATTRVRGCVLDPSLPAKLTRYAHVQPLCAGFLNASARPYSAAGDGVTDDTATLQSALDDAYALRMAVLLQPGRTFLLTSQLQAIQQGLPPLSRAYGYQLIGARGGPPPVLKVQDNAPVAGFPSYFTSDLPQAYEARPVVRFALNMTNPEHHNEPITPQMNNPGSHYSALMRNIVIDLGDNPALR